jgi:D-amino-acid oxidase
MRIQVIGAGVCGLSCAIRLQEAGHSVAIRAAAVSPATTSDVAAALWLPFALDTWSTDAARQATVSYRELAELAANEPDSGVRMRSVLGWFDAAETARWRDVVRGWRRCDPGALPAGVAARPGDRHAHLFAAPVADTRRFLPWLLARFQRMAAPADRAIDRRPLRALTEPFADGFELIVNCAGQGAAELAGDAAMYAAEGQIVRVAPCGIDFALVDDVDLEECAGARVFTYVVPRTEDLVLGGTFRQREPGDWRAPLPIAELRARILARCRARLPALAGARVLDERAGLRPLRRGGPRVQLERHAAGPIVHDYGHGGAGVTLALGCARDVVAAVASCP